MSASGRTSHPHPPASMLWFSLTRVWTGLSCTCCNNHCDFMCSAWLLCSENTATLKLTATFGFYNALFHEDTQQIRIGVRWKWSLMCKSLFKLVTSEFLIFFLLNSCGSLCSFSPTGRSLFDEGWEVYWTVVIATVH